MSMVEVEHLPSPGGGFTAGLATAPSQARVLLRDLANKASWDASALYCSPQDLPQARRILRKPHFSVKRKYNQNENLSKPLLGFNRFQFTDKSEEPPMSLMLPSMPPRGTLRHRPPHILPDFSNAAPDMDSLHDLLRYIGHTSPECLENPDQDLSEPGPTPAPLTRQTEAEVISAILAQRTAETEYIQYSYVHVTKNCCRV